ncbi:MAG: hypothetical protein JO331_14860 [Verrucomicrobia bacterium]|nr:hypothetical protein [Verrucomicrobiota bacterium]
MTIKSIVTKSLICSAVALATVSSASAHQYNQGELPNPDERFVSSPPQVSRMYDTARDIVTWPFNLLSKIVGAVGQTAVQSQQPQSQTPADDEPFGRCKCDFGGCQCGP